MSTNIREWLNTSMEESQDAPTIIQDGDTPKEDFSTATNTDSGEVETDKPAVAEIDAASDGAEKGKDIDQGHQEVHVPDNDGKVSNESSDDDDGSTEQDSGLPKAPQEKEVVEPSSQTETETDKPVTAKLDANEAGDEQKTPESDDQIDPDPKGAQTNNVSSEVHHEAVEQDDVPQSPEGGEVNDEPEDAPVEEEEVPAADAETDVTPAPEEDPDDMEDDLAAVTKVEDDIDHFNRVSESLERYYDILSRGMEEHDGIYGETAEAIRIGLENLDPMFQEEEVIPAMEAFGQVSSRHTATYISLESLSSKMKTVIEATRRAIAKLFEMLKDIFNKAINGTLGMTKRVDELKTRAKALSDKNSQLPSYDVDMMVNGATRFQVGGKFVANDPKQIDELIRVGEYVFNDFPQGADKVLETVKGLIDRPTGYGDNADAISEDVGAAIARYIPKPPGASQQVTEKIIYNRGTVVLSERCLSLAQHKLQYGPKLDLRVAKMRMEGPNKTQITVARPRDILALLDKIQKLIDMLNSTQRNSRYVDSVKKRANDIVDEFAKKSDQTLKVDEAKSIVTQVARSVAQPNAEYIQFLVGTVRSYLALLSEQIKTWEDVLKTQEKVSN